MCSLELTLTYCVIVSFSGACGHNRPRLMLPLECLCGRSLRSNRHHLRVKMQVVCMSKHFQGKGINPLSLHDYFIVFLIRRLYRRILRLKHSQLLHLPNSYVFHLFYMSPV